LDASGSLVKVALCVFGHNFVLPLLSFCCAVSILLMLAAYVMQQLGQQRLSSHYSKLRLMMQLQQEQVVPKRQHKEGPQRVAQGGPCTASWWLQ
jgi:hypothetical protein